jgi:hypothetical protein
MRVEVLNEIAEANPQISIGEFVRVRIHYKAEQPVDNPVFNLVLRSIDGTQVTGIRTDVDGVSLGMLKSDGFIDVCVPRLNLLPNIYLMDAVIFHQDGYTFYDRVNKVAHLKLVGGHQIDGVVYLPHIWQNGDKNYDRTIAS